jgi:membrane fusion protein, multidrug efflux system
VATEAQSQPTSASEAKEVPKQKREHAAEPRLKKQRGIFKIAIAVIAIIAIAFGVGWWIKALKYESTDDSYVTGRSHPVSFRVNGTVSEVLVDDNQLVKAGQPIAKLDPRDYVVQLQQTEASLQQARAQLKQSDTQLSQAQAQLQQSKAQAESAKARFENSQRLAERNRQLFSRGGAISQQDLDNSIFQMLQDQGSYESAEAAVEVAEANVETARAQRGASLAQVSSVEANLEYAKLQLSYTTLYSPTDGRIAKKPWKPDSEFSRHSR